jgi:hypothetical protein
MSEQSHPSQHRLPPSVGERLDRICDSFEAAWKTVESASQRPRIEEYLGTTPEPERSALLRELTALDIAYRRRAEEEIQTEEYGDRFPALNPAELSATLAPDPMTAVATEAGPSPQGSRAMSRSAHISPPRYDEPDAGSYDFLAPSQGPDELGRLCPLCPGATPEQISSDGTRNPDRLLILHGRRGAP